MSHRSWTRFFPLNDPRAGLLGAPTSSLRVAVVFAAAVDVVAVIAVAVKHRHGWRVPAIFSHSASARGHQMPTTKLAHHRAEVLLGQ